MRQYRTEKKEINELDKIICNKCGRVIEVVRGVAREEYLAVDKRWGYFSNKDKETSLTLLSVHCAESRAITRRRKGSP
jgi:hypothetical protein